MMTVKGTTNGDDFYTFVQAYLLPHLMPFEGARTYCIINEAMPSGAVAMDYFSQLKAVLNALPHPQHYLA